MKNHLSVAAPDVGDLTGPITWMESTMVNWSVGRQGHRQRNNAAGVGAMAVTRGGIAASKTDLSTAHAAPNAMACYFTPW